MVANSSQTSTICVGTVLPCTTSEPRPKLKFHSRSGQKRGGSGPIPKGLQSTGSLSSAPFSSILEKPAYSKKFNPATPSLLPPSPSKEEQGEGTICNKFNKYIPQQEIGSQPQQCSNTDALRGRPWGLVTAKNHGTSSILFAMHWPCNETNRQLVNN